MKLSPSQIATIRTFFQDKPVKKVYVFGSYARGDADENSDIDLLIDWDYSKGIGWEVMDYKEKAALLLKKEVDFVSLKWVDPLIEDYVNKDKKLVYDRAA